MTTSIAILGCVFLGLVTAVPLESSDCSGDFRSTSSDNVLVGKNTPVYFFRPKKHFSPELTLIRQEDAMVNLKKQSTFFHESGDGKNGINNKCQKSEVLSEEQNYPIDSTAPSTIYPRIVVVVDYGIYQRYENKSNKLTKLLEHVLAVWNGVDLNFRTFENPKIRLNIAGIIVEEHADVVPFLTYTNEDGSLNHEATTYLFSEFTKTVGSSWSKRFGRFHIVTAMTSKKIYSKYLQREGEVTSFYDLFCEKNITGPTHRFVFADKGDWLQIRKLSYNLAKSFESSVVGRDGLKCSRDDSVSRNYYWDQTMELPEWSKCFVDSFEMRFNNTEAVCLFEKPKIISPLPRLLPGQIIGCDDQCSIREGKTCCIYVELDESICRNLLCEYDNVACFDSRSYAADGTICGDRKMCFHGKCVFREDIE